ncbi:MAG: type II secretion system secretin GspD, partial [Burkholderiales bacterium]
MKFLRLCRAFVGAVTIAALTAPPSLAQIPPQPPGMQQGSAASPIQPAPQQPGRRGVDDSVTLNFVNADIQAVIKAAAEITNRNILIDPRVTGTVNIVAPKPIPRAMVFSILLSALRAQGFAAVGGESGIVRIVPEAEAKFFPSVGDARTARGDQVVTQVFQLQHESAQQMVPILRPLVSPNNVINAFPASNTLIITDYAENLHRIARVIASVDQPNPGELVSIRVQHANALDIAQTIGRLVPEAAAPVAPGAAPKLAVTVDSRSNTLLIRADNPSLAGRIRTIVTTLDTPGTVAGNIHVVYLKNAEAAKVAEALRGILTGQASQRTAAPTTGFGAASTTGGGIGGLGGQQQPGGNQPGLGGAGGLGGLGGGAAGIGSSFGQPGAAGAQGAQQQQGFQGGGVMVQAYPETNSLVIVAPDHLYNQLRGVIEKLDARRAQIYVEALIVEVSASTAAEFGIQWQDLAGAAANGTRLIGGTNFSVTPGSNIIQGAQNPGSLGPGLNLGVVRGTINIPGISGAVLNLGVLARALETNAGANILSTPTLLTLDNEEAKIIVGQNIPIVTGSFTLNTAGGAGAQNPFQTFDRRDVGLSLRVKPQVAEGGSVKLQIAQEVSSLVQSAQFNAQSVITNKRAIESTVIVDDGQIVVLGGLISDDVQNTAQGVPGLSKIPFIGGLFRYEQRQRQKTNLMVFLRPFVIRDNEQQQ